jgi:hypothetical protein
MLTGQVSPQEHRSNSGNPTGSSSPEIGHIHHVQLYSLCTAKWHSHGVGVEVGIEPWPAIPTIIRACSGLCLPGEECLFSLFSGTEV